MFSIQSKGTKGTRYGINIKLRERVNIFHPLIQENPSPLHACQFSSPERNRTSKAERPFIYFIRGSDKYFFLISLKSQARPATRFVMAAWGLSIWYIYFGRTLLLLCTKWKFQYQTPRSLAVSPITDLINNSRRNNKNGWPCPCPSRPSNPIFSQERKENIIHGQGGKRKPHPTFHLLSLLLKREKGPWSTSPFWQISFHLTLLPSEDPLGGEV